ncbi:MAG: 4a-hydroxytetrahydrobiopterin dehydratase [Bacteroidia bacterium]
MKTYNEQEAISKLESLRGWTFEDKGIEKEYEFDNFVEAFSFMTKVAMLSERANHHPELFNVYNQVHVRYTTHDAGGLTDKDFALAAAIDE